MARRLAHGFMLAILASLLATTAALAQGAWLPSCTEGAAKQAVISMKPDWRRVFSFSK
jgi:hypothetical protein